MKNRILILFAHPRYEKSLNNRVLVNHIPKIPEITFHDLYERYPDFNIDIEKEKKLLLDHDVIVWMHPFYWYSAPALMKQWIDMVLEFGWAYGPGGTQLQGKMAFNVITTGGQRAVYSHDGYNRYTIKEFMTPFDQTAALCKMSYLPPFALHGTHRVTKEEALKTASQFGELLENIVNGGFFIDEIKRFDYLNDWVENENH